VSIDLPTIQVPTARGQTGARSAQWHRAARLTKRLSWVSLVWMCAEGAVGLASGVAAGSVSLVGWGLASFVEGLAAVIVIWRFTGSRALSDTAELRAQKLVAISLFLLAPYLIAESLHDIVAGHRASASTLGIAITASSVVVMPLLGRTKQRLGRTLGSSATAGEGAQNLLCAAQAAIVLLGTTLIAISPSLWFFDPAAAGFIAYVAVREGRDAWQGESCDCC
jgi:divalent metal cation (Fe/Co/Zn/Cd) transporter